MDNFFFRSNPWSSTPNVRRRQPDVAPKPSKPNKVISVPVHFVAGDGAPKPIPTKTEPNGPLGAERREVAAVRVQRVVRGFLVRKNLRIVKKIEEEVDGIEVRIRREIDMIQRDKKERLRLNEMLMRLLFRLDSVRGVRDYRKKVIRRVIALQEAVDAITAVQESAPVEAGDRESVAVDAGSDGLEADIEGETLDRDQLDEIGCPNDGSGAVGGGDRVGDASNRESMVIDEGSKDLEVDIKAETIDRVQLDETKDANNDEMEETVESEPEDDKSKRTPATNVEKVSGKEKSASSSVEDAMRGAMERMTAENERLQRLMSELCERSEQQCRMMGGLAQRLENLERTVQRMEAKHKKKMSKRCKGAA